MNCWLFIQMRQNEQITHQLIWILTFMIPPRSKRDRRDMFHYREQPTDRSPLQLSMYFYEMISAFYFSQQW